MPLTTPFIRPPRLMRLAFGVATIGFTLSLIGLITTLVTQQASSPSVNHPGKLYLSPLSATVQAGQTVRFAIRITPATPIDTVTATVRYAPDSLTYQKVEFDNSSFPANIPAALSSDTITIQAAQLGGSPVKADALIATLVFTARQPGLQRLMLTAGDAAYAGVATHPALASGDAAAPSVQMRVLPWIGGLVISTVAISGLIILYKRRQPRNQAATPRTSPPRSSL